MVSNYNPSKNKKVNNFYSTIKAKVASENFIKSSKVGVFANSSNHLNTVSLTTDDMYKYDYCIFVQYDKDDSVIGKFSIAMKDVMPVLNDYYNNGGHMVCDSSCLKEDQGMLVRIPFGMLEPYRMNN